MPINEDHDEDNDDDDSEATVDYGDLFVKPDDDGDFGENFSFMSKAWHTESGTINLDSNTLWSCGPVEWLDQFPGMGEPPDAKHEVFHSDLEYSARDSKDMTLLSSTRVELGIEKDFEYYIQNFFDEQFGEDVKHHVAEYLSYPTYAQDETQEQLIQKEYNILSLDEARQHSEKCELAMFEELKRWFDLGAFERQRRTAARNVLDARWVLKWKLVNKIKEIRARMTVRGYRDKQAADLATFSATSSRWGQRLCAICAVQYGWFIFSVDVSQAFLRGLPYSELAKLEGELVRDVSFTVPPGAIPLLQRLPGFGDFDGRTEVLRMLRPGFGLKDAPRAWSLALERTLADFGLFPACTDAQLYMKHVGGRLVLIITVHVDDLKGAGEPKEVTDLIKHLEVKFGKLKREDKSFDHVGIKHEQKESGEIVMHQKSYAESLSVIDLSKYTFENSDTLVPAPLVKAYQTLLGGAAWMTMTCPAVCVYVSYLQRHSKGPTYKHVKDLNRLVRWLKRNPQEIWYRRLTPPTRLVAVTDSAFSAGDTEGLVMRGCLLLLVEMANPSTSPVGRVQLLDWFARKQPHVCRSTFAAELHAALDGLNQAMLVQTTLHEVQHGVMSADALLRARESGEMTPRLELAIDAKAVFDALTAAVVRVPADKHLYLHLRKLREFLDERQLWRIWWVDTRMMLADGMTKGVVDRECLVRATLGRWRHEGLDAVAWPARD